MADVPNGVGRRADPRDGREYVTMTGAPGWVKIAAVTMLIIAVVVIIVIAMSGGDHSPGQHMLPGLVATVEGALAAPAA